VNILSNFKTEVKIQNMSIEDIDAILSIDKKIRKKGEVITYQYLTTESILTIDRKMSRRRDAISYADMITGDISGILEHSFVAKVNDKVCGFVISRIASIGHPATKVGLILIMGVSPDYRRQGVATKLANALMEKYRSERIKEIRIPIDERDKQLRDFFSHIGFDVGHLIEYSKRL